MTGAQRNPDDPEVPAFAELGVPGMDDGPWSGVLGPARLPQPVVDKLAAAMARVLQMPDVRAGHQDGGAVVDQAAGVVQRDRLHLSHLAAASRTAPRLSTTSQAKRSTRR